MIMALVFLSAFLTIGAGIANYVAQFSRVENFTIASAQALNLAEAGIDYALYELNENPSYTGESDIDLPNGSVEVLVENEGLGLKNITATAYVPNETDPVATRQVKAAANIGSGVVSFRYGVQAGNGGFHISGGSTLNGSVYANGDIVATNGVHITGSAVAANQPAVAADQVNDTPFPINSCSSASCINFGNSSATEDLAQSFKISVPVPLNSIQLYLKKVGTPGNITVRIVTNNSGSPGTQTLMSSVLSSSAVTGDFGWVTVTMPTTPILDPSQTYWLVLDAPSNPSRYYIIGSNVNGYGDGQVKLGRLGSSWSATSPSNLDGYFKIYLGGGTSTIGGNDYVTGVYIGTTEDDIAWGHTVRGATVTGAIYCQTGSYTNKPCDTSRADPTPQPMPLSDGQIAEWKQDASVGEPIDGDYHVGWAGASLGPKKITGDLIIDGGGLLTVTGTLWVEGNISLSGGGKVKLDPSYGANSGTIINDGYIVLAGGSNFSGSGQDGSYPFLITTSACPAAPDCNGNDAISLSGGAGTVALIAQNGNINIAGGGALKAVTGKQITMTGGAILYYDTGLINENFSSGPGGSYQIVPGTYVISD